MEKLAVIIFRGTQQKLPLWKVDRLKFEGTQLFDAILNNTSELIGFNFSSAKINC